MYAAEAKAMMNEAVAPVVREKSFDEFHLYTLARPTTLQDQETKQVEFVRSTGIHAQRLYVYDGAQVDSMATTTWNRFARTRTTARNRIPKSG